jgi:S1-C subfamily serine protease
MIFPDENPTPTQPTTPTPPPADAPPRTPLRPLLAVTVLAVAMAAFGGAALSHVLWPGDQSVSSAQNNGNSIFGGGFRQLLPNQSGGNSGGTSSASSAHAAAVAKKIDPGLVDINTQDGQSAAAGTGMVVSSDGEVITNNHVIKGANSISATDLGNGRTYTARVVGYDRQHDVAVLMLDGASGLATVPLGDSAGVHVGASVLTFGNAGGVGGTPSLGGGSVSALGRSITASDSEEPGDSERLSGLIQINGQIEPGDSGGPLTSGGKVIGMDTAASTGFDFQSASGAGYAIPINEAISISNEILRGHATNTIHIGATAIIGVYVAANNKQSLTYYGCPSSEVSESGVLIAAGAVTGSPAANLGLARCELITSVGGIKVSSPGALLNVMETHHPGDSVSFGWLDGSGGAHSATIHLATGTPD